MRKSIAGLWCCLSAGLAAGLVHAEAPVGRPAVSLDRPRVRAAAPDEAEYTPPASLGRPVPVTSSVFDPQVTHASFSGTVITPARARVQNQTDELHAPMPVGPPAAVETGPPLAAPPGTVVVPNASPAPGPGGCEACAPAPACDPCPPLCCPADACAVGCTAPLCCGDGPCGPPYCFWVSGEFLLWKVKNQSVPPLVTMGSPFDAVPGALGQAGTTILVGSNSLNLEELSGARVTAGTWLYDDQCLGLEGSAFLLAQRSANFLASSPGMTVLARPFTNAQTGLADAELVSFPNLLAGSVAVRSTTRLWGADANLRHPVWCGPDFRLDAVAGFRYAQLDESLTIGESLTTLAATPVGMTLVPPGGVGIQVTDHFATHNYFYGGQVGLEGEWRWCRWFVDGSAKVAIGYVHEVVGIDGSTTVTVPSVGINATQAGGLLALSSNIGQYKHDRFAVLPEGEIKVGYQLTDHLRAFVGYNFLYISRVVRPGDQIDPTVNRTLLPVFFGPSAPTGPGRPMFIGRDSEFWAQGVTVGLELRY